MKIYWNKLLAEAVGTGTLTFLVLSSVAIELPVSTPVIAGLTLGLFVYTIGAISGSHINPAVTIGLWSIGKIDIREGVEYIMSQVVGALVAMYLFTLAFGISVPAVTMETSLPIFIAEAVGAAILLFGICSVVYQKVNDSAAGLVIGGSLLLGILVAAPLSGGVLNPAVALGSGSISWGYFIAPVVGAVASCWFYRWLVAKRK